jgi:REP element-mobilizing transposase RayT
LGLKQLSAARRYTARQVILLEFVASPQHLHALMNKPSDRR